MYAGIRLKKANLLTANSPIIYVNLSRLKALLGEKVKDSLLIKADIQKGAPVMDQVGNDVHKELARFVISDPFIRIYFEFVPKLWSKLCGNKTMLNRRRTKVNQFPMI